MNLGLSGMVKVDGVVLGRCQLSKRDNFDEIFQTFSVNKVIYVSIVKSLCFLYFSFLLYCGVFLMSFKGHCLGSLSLQILNGLFLKFYY